MHGVRPTERLRSGAYRDEVTRAVYRALAHRAARTVAAYGGVIVDATCRSRALRQTLSGHLGDVHPLVAVVCTAPAPIRRARVQARLTDPTRVSDADVAVAETLAAQFEPIDAEPEIDRALDVHTDQPLAAALDALAAQLDGAPETETP